MKDKITLAIDSKYFYTLLIQSARYACSRNNNLEPSCTFEELKSVLPMYYITDDEWAMRTAKQLCEEIICELNYKFYDGDDDPYGNRAHYLDMILWLLDFIVDNEGEWKPYNWDNYIYNISTDCKKQYFIENIDTNEVLNKEPLSRKEYLDYIMKEVLKANQVIYSKELDLQDNRINAITYRFEDPIKINLYVYKIKDVNEGD